MVRLAVEPVPGNVVERFALGGRVLSAAPLGEGHINATYLIATESECGTGRRYVLQRINRAVFRDPKSVIRNVKRVIAHLGSKVREEGGNPEREVLNLIPTQEGAAFLCDAEGEVWRCYAMIEGATARSTLTGPDQAFTVAKAFGRFLRQASDFPADALAVTIPGFHDASRHMQALHHSVRDDPLDRASGTLEEFEFIEEHRGLIETWAGLRSSEDVPTRVVHNDTKIDNVLVDDDSGLGICIIDLDTVMPGTALVDVGDCARSALTGPEDIGRPLDLAIFDAVIRGYLDEAGGLLTDAEIEHTVFATRLIALELGIRFLADHIAGDRWFPVADPSENLDRCRAQLDLVRGIEGNEDEMVGIVRRASRSRRRRRRGPRTTDGL